MIFRIVLKNDVARIEPMKGLPSWQHIEKYTVLMTDKTRLQYVMYTCLNLGDMNG
jgi:hypothetical protein